MSPEERIIRLETQMANVLEDFLEMKADNKEMKADIRVIRDTLQEAKGGWRMLLLVGGACGTAGALVGKFLPAVFR